MQAFDVQSIFSPEVLCGGVQSRAGHVEQPINPSGIHLASSSRLLRCCHPDPPVCAVFVANTVVAPLRASQSPHCHSHALRHAAVPRADVTRNPSPPARRPRPLARKTHQLHPQANFIGAPVIPGHAQAVFGRAQFRTTASTARNRSRATLCGLRASRIQRRLRQIQRRMPRGRWRATHRGLRAKQKAPRVELFTRRAGLRASRLGWAGWHAGWHAAPSGH